MIDLFRDYLEAGFRVFGLHGVTQGICDCGNPDCAALYKHPLMRNWQHTPQWSAEQLDVMEDKGDFDTGYGILIKEHLVVDCDPRNGGQDSFERLCNALSMDLHAEAKHSVTTGGGGFHLFFQHTGNALKTCLPDYPGLDFKTSGFVVGAGSFHISGQQYEILKGTPHDIDQAPPRLIDLLIKPQAHRSTINGVAVDVEETQIAEMLSYIDPDCDYEQWVKILMGVHHGTGGTGLELVDEWSSKGAKYCGYNALERKWHSFGKTRENPCTLGTLVYYAEKSGYKMPVTFAHEVAAVTHNPDIDTQHVDPLRPPGFVGDVAAWVRSCTDKRTDTLAVATSLAIVSNIAGLTYISDDPKPAYTNLFCFCVASSGAGKGSMLNCVQEAMIKVGYAGAINSGSFKSEQAIVRAMLRHQLVAYVVDEIGLELSKIGKSQADYLQGITKNLMSAFSASDSRYGVEAEALEDAKKVLRNRIAAESKLLEENEGDQALLDSLQRTLQSLEQNAGVEKPFVSITGYTTPETFNHLVSGYSIKQGFFTRALIFREKETVPAYDENYPGRPPLPDAIGNVLCGIAATGNTLGQRIENLDERKQMPTTDTGKALLKQIRRLFHQAEKEAKSVGLESIYARAYELTLKLSLVLAIGEGVRTTEHITWAYAVVAKNIEDKKNLAAANIAEEYEDHGEALCRRIIDQLDKQEGAQITLGVLKNRVRNKKWTSEDIDKAVNFLAENGQIIAIETETKRGITKKLYLP